MGLKNRWLFKAVTLPTKDEPTTKWVDGSLIVTECCNGGIGCQAEDPNLYYIHQRISIFADWNMPYDYWDYPVNSDTICACSGKTDKWGNLIYERDILRYNRQGEEIRLIVTFNEGEFWLADIPTFRLTYPLFPLKSECLEVISNEHDDAVTIPQ